jgi:hypothetical protein
MVGEEDMSIIMVGIFISLFSVSSAAIAAKL